MSPKATTANNASANASTLNANAQPKRKRTRGRGGRGRGGRGKKDVSSDSSSDSSSSSDDDSSDDEDEVGALKVVVRSFASHGEVRAWPRPNGSAILQPVSKHNRTVTFQLRQYADTFAFPCTSRQQPVASTSKIATAPSAAKSVSSTPAAPSNGKGKSASSSASSSSDEDSDDEGNASDSSSSSSSFLTTSDEEEDMPTPRNVRGQNTQGSAVDDASTYGQSQRGFEGQDEAARAKRPEMTKPSDPPYIQFGADADLAHNARAFGKPILWGLLPGDTPAASTSASLFDDETDERSKAIIEAEKAKAEERYLKFRDDYVSKMISRFGGSLDAIRQKEADIMKESRLQVLIQSIAGGADTFTSRDGQGIWKTKEQRGEREVVLEGLELQIEQAQEEGDDHDMSQ